MNNTIELQQAIEMTTLFRAQRDIIIDPIFRERNLLSISETFDRAAFDKVLSQSGCTGLRIYFGMKEDLQLRAIIVGINENNEDMLPENSSDEEIIIEEGSLCPPLCAPPSPLNP